MAPASTGALSAGTGTSGDPATAPAGPIEAPASGPLGPSGSALADAGDLLRALAAPVRIAIVLQLREADRCVHELVDALDVAQPLISQHLRVLKTAGVVQGERRGREVVYRLVDDHLAHIVVDAVTHVQEGK
ncbi:metalloregulator ArsR/SmtB family transcription factor [Amycolatopsis carbonis]|uniref:Metalloregulator ArsR/SmtB family transcription factor n=1 Tax=Amycolatopsis carbonis TaxID=715471 RepID=A0A9Y2MW08_9PSEU|nr:metalloregulator ArsR/SmtB family transcription factor [Amycolatopsis sp. 2-15]WIX83440.1 metalloregulator ArsR/SmtB family transcription factor [Amycolatopsis sp. 2-15]